MFLYPNGTIVYFRVISLTISCLFEYNNIPSDSHVCPTVAYITNEFSDTSRLRHVTKYPSTPISYLTWLFEIEFENNVDVRWRTQGEGVNSGIKYRFNFSRDAAFLQQIFVVPSIILVILAYTTFWIDSEKASARVIFAITNILNAISLLVSTNDYIPQVPYKTWLQEFLIWNLIFTFVPMIQYAILNAAICSFTSSRARIAHLVSEVRAMAAKLGLDHDPDYILGRCRKLIAVAARKTITGGDVMRIEGF